MRRCLTEVDQAITAGSGLKLHRVARQLSLPGAAVRENSDAWLATPEAPLQDFPILVVAVQSYACIPLVERRI